jgi:hypothetical protein
VYVDENKIAGGRQKQVIVGVHKRRYREHPSTRAK